VKATSTAGPSPNRDAVLDLVDLAPFGVYVVDSSFRIAHINRVAQARAFRNVNPAVGRDLAEAMRILWPEDVAVQACALFRHTLETGEPYYSADFREPRADIDDVESYEWELHRIALRDGAPAVVCFYFDSTKLRQAEDALAQQRRQYEAILNTTPDLAYIFDLDHRFTYANDGLLKMWGKTREEALGKTCLELGYEPWHAAMHDREIDQVVATKAPVRGEVPFSGTYGKRVYDYIFTPVLDASGDVVAVAGTTRDVTDYRRAQESLSHHARQFETLLEQAPLGVYLVDAGFRIREANPIAQSTFGDISGGVIGRELGGILRRVWPADFADEIMRLFRHTLETGEPRFEPERPGVRVDRKVTEYYEWRLDRIVLPDGHFGVVCYFRDISEEVAAREALRVADRRKDEFLAMLAHELRNPLAPIRNATQILHQVNSDNPAVAMASAMLERQVQHMVRLVDDLLDVSRITRGRIELRRGRVELGAAVSDAVEAARPLFTRQDQALAVTVPSGPIYLDADPSRLAQIIGNLLNNASKFTPRGGHVGLSVSRENGNAVIRVKDDGIGIAPEERSRIFELFAQVDTSLERSQSGLGIGLTLVKNLVELHGGSVEAASEGVGKGSEFTVRLPAIADATLAPRASERQRSPILDPVPVAGAPHADVEGGC
jgi:PAS domain S-box-containing protein